MSNNIFSLLAGFPNFLVLFGWNLFKQNAQKFQFSEVKPFLLILF